MYKLDDVVEIRIIEPIEFNGCRKPLPVNTMLKCMVVCVEPLLFRTYLNIDQEVFLDEHQAIPVCLIESF